MGVNGLEESDRPIHLDLGGTLIHIPQSQQPQGRSASGGHVLRLSKIGKMDVILHRPIPDGFILKQATLIRKADGG